MALMRRETAEAILVTQGLGEESAQLLCQLLTHMEEHGGPQRDPGQTIQGNVQQCAAQLSVWCKKLDVCPNFEAGLQLKGSRKAMYNQLSYPVGEATIEKGSTLTMEEVRAMMAR